MLGIDPELLYSVALLLTLGVAGGFLAGLLGIGGGTVIVPGLYYLFVHMGYGDYAMHIAVGTSLCTVVCTGTSSAFAHYKKGAFDFLLLRQMGIGLAIGVAIGTWLASIFQARDLKMVFAVAQIIFASYMLLSRKKVALFSAMPRQPFTSLIAACNSCLSTLKGMGGGVQNVLFMTICNVPMHRAIGTASGLGVISAFLGGLGFMFIGQDIVGLPPYSFGYVNIACFGVIILTSVLMAPVGAHVAHGLPVDKLRKVFAVFLLLVAGKMLTELFF